MRAPVTMKAAGWALFFIFILLTLDALFRHRSDLDYELMRWVGRIDFPGAETAFRFFSGLTGPSYAIYFLTASLAAALVTRRWLIAVGLGASSVVAGVNALVQFVVHRERPEWSRLDFSWMTPDEIVAAAAQNDYASFPSGHVVGAVVIYGFTFFLAGYHLRRRWISWPVQAACLAILVAAGLSRIWLGANWVGDVVAGYALGSLALLLVVSMYRTLEPTVRGVPLVRAGPVPHDESRPHAHALTSTILFRGDEVTKIYNPGFGPRLIYWVSFQAPFAYAHNPVALRAAVARRNLVGKLSEYWFGSNRVAEALRVEHIDGRLAITGRFTDGVEPRDHHRAREFLSELADRFEEAGLPTWQIDPRQPRSIGNLLELEDGSYRIIDLESGLVAPLASLRAIWRGVRRALVPMYDDVYFDLTRAYVDREASAMASTHGEAWVADLRERLNEAEVLAAEWHAAEPRFWSHLVRFVSGGFGVVPAIHAVRAKMEQGRERADEWLEGAVADWRAQGRINDVQEQRLRESIASPEINSVLPHFGIHLIIGVALRFPFGSIVRTSYTTANLLLACVRFGFRRIDRETWRRSARIHSPLVILIAAMPAIGTFSYLASGPVRSQHLLVRVVFDSVGEKIPFSLYRRLGLRRLIAGKESAGER